MDKTISIKQASHNKENFTQAHYKTWSASHKWLLMQVKIQQNRVQNIKMKTVTQGK